MTGNSAGRRFRRLIGVGSPASGGSMPRRELNPDQVAVQLSPGVYTLDGRTVLVGDIKDALDGYRELAAAPGLLPHACETLPMCDTCRTEFEAWKAAKGKP